MSDIEETLNRIKNTEGVKSYIIADSSKEVIRSFPAPDRERSEKDMSLFKSQASILCDLANKARSAIRDIDPNNNLLFLRLRAKNEEIILAPNSDFTVIVDQRWTPATFTPPVPKQP